jgi:hypothetical protein
MHGVFALWCRWKLQNYQILLSSKAIQAALGCEPRHVVIGRL